MQKSIFSIGPDVHAKNITIACVEGGGGEGRLLGTIPNHMHVLERDFAKFGRTECPADSALLVTVSARDIRACLRVARLAIFTSYPLTGGRFLAMKATPLKFTIEALLLGTFSYLATAAPADLDVTFGGTGKVTTDFGAGEQANSVAVQSDGKIVVAGYSTVNGGYNFAVARYNPAGSLDLTFNGTGKVTTDFLIATGLALQSDGKIVVAGFNPIGIPAKNAFAVVRYNANGTLDTDFNGTGKVLTSIGTDGDARGVAVQTDGKIVVAGTASDGSSYDIALIRYNTDGTLDTTFNGTGKVTASIGSGDDVGNSVAVQSDNKIVVAGTTVNGSNRDFVVVRYNANGTLDTDFNGTGKVTVNFGTYDICRGMAVQSDGKIVVAGFTQTSSSYFALARLTVEGILDPTFNGTGRVTTDFGGSVHEANGVALAADGKIIVAGVFGSGPGGSTWDFALVRYNDNGTLDAGFNGTGMVTTAIGSTRDAAQCVAVQNDGKIVTAGSFDSSLSRDIAVARYEGVSVTVSEPQTVSLGSPATFSALVTGGGSPDYQWRKDGVAIPGATGISFTIPSAQPWHVGEYTVVVNGSNTSAPAPLQITSVPTGVWKGLIAYYPFNGNAHDQSLSGNDGTDYGASLTTNRFGVADSAYRFDGIDDYIEIPDSVGFKSQDFTIAMWFKPERYPNIAVNTEAADLLISKGQNNFEIHTGSEVTGATGMKLLPRYAAGNDWSAPTDSYRTNEWQFVVAVYQPSLNQIHFYLNGSEKALTGPANKPIGADNTLSLWVGMRRDNTLPFKGGLDDVRIYNRALSLSEVQQLNAIEDPDSDGDGIRDRFETGTGIYVSAEDTGTSPTNRDSDGDGLTDGQEVFTYFSNPNVTDTDGDGFDDGFEVSTGFSATSAASTPDALSAIYPAVEYRFNAANGVSYRIEASTDLGTWDTIETPIVGTGGVVTRFYSTVGVPKRFFRSRRN